MAKIDVLADKALAGQLRWKRDQATRLFKLGEIVASERLADDIWKLLGIPTPKTDMNVRDR